MSWLYSQGGEEETRSTSIHSDVKQLLKETSATKNNKYLPYAPHSITFFTYIVSFKFDTSTLRK